MSYYWLDGYDVYPNATDAHVGLANLWTVSSGVSMATGRFGGRCVSMNYGAWSGGSPTVDSGMERIYAASGSGPTSSICGFAVKFSVLPHTLPGYSINWMPLAGFIDTGGSGSVTCGINATGNLVYINSAGMGAVVYTSSTMLLTDVWYYIEFTSTNSGGQNTTTVYVNGASAGTYTGAPLGTNYDTLFLGPAFFGNVNGTMLFDDTYMASGNTSLGAQRIETLVPNSDVSASGWTPSSGSTIYPMVNELPTDGGTTYVSQTVYSSADAFFTTAGLSGAPVSISCLQQRVCAQSDQTDSGYYGYITNGLSTGGIYTYGGPDEQPHTLTSNYGYYLDIWAQQPTGSYPYSYVPWTYSTVNAANPGIDTGD